jgi:hypothetical protein
MNSDAKKKSYFMRGLNTKIQTMMTTCYNATYHEVVNVAIALEEKSRIHKELKKKKQVSSSSSGSSKKHQKFIYHPRTISALRTVRRNIKPGSRRLSVLPQPNNIHNSRMPLAFEIRTSKPITFPAITVKSQATSQRTAHIQGSITPITQEPSHCNSSRIRVRAII